MYRNVLYPYPTKLTQKHYAPNLFDPLILWISEYPLHPILRYSDIEFHVRRVRSPGSHFVHMENFSSHATATVSLQFLFTGDPSVVFRIPSISVCLLDARWKVEKPISDDSNFL